MVSIVKPISDVDVGSQFGIATIQVDSSNGTWQFSTNGGHSWVTLTNVCPQNATLLRSYPIAMDKVRFFPNKYFFGNVSLWFLAWDLTSGEVTGTQSIDVWYPEVYRFRSVNYKEYPAPSTIKLSLVKAVSVPPSIDLTPIQFDNVPFAEDFPLLPISVSSFRLDTHGHH